MIQLAMLLFCSLAFAQNDIDLKWSEQFIYDNKLDGFFDDYVGVNSKFVYAKFSNLTRKSKKADSKVKLLVFDKTTMKKAGELELKGYNSKYEDLDYYRTVVLDENIYVIWQKEKKGLTEIYAESFDAKLKSKKKLSKIYEVNKSKSGYENMFIISNRLVDNRILIGKELAVTKDRENLRLEYKLMDSEFSLISSKQITLPIEVDKKRGGGLVCDYEFGDNGQLYIQDMIRLSFDEIKMLKKGEASTYPFIMQVNLDNGELGSYGVKFMKKNTFNSSYLITKKAIRVYGFFSDLEKDEKGKDTHGIYYISLDPVTFKPMDIKFSYFEKSFLDILYAADKENQKKGKGLFKSKKAKASDDQSIDDNYIIERVIEDGNDIVLFCTIMRNWQKTVCSTSSNGATSCVTYYYCTKSNVTAFKLNTSGEILWAKNLDRSITYNRWDVHDLNVVKDNDNYYVVYGSAYQINAKKKNGRSYKSGQQQQDRFEYATFASSTGNFKKAEYSVNGFNVKKADKKYVNASNVMVMDNRMYTSCVRTKLKPATYISLLCPPVFLVLYNFNMNVRKGKGFLGTIGPVK